MGENKGVIDRHAFAIFGGGALAVIGLIFLISILLGAFIFLIDFSGSSSDSSIIKNSGSEIGIPNLITKPSNSLSAIDNSNNSEVPNPVAPTNDSLWTSIGLSVVEKTCLTQAKIQAGDLAWGVNSCSCSETKTDSEKNYSCAVLALDGQHNLEVNCVKNQNNCIIISEQGNFVFSFEQLYELVQ